MPEHSYTSAQRGWLLSLMALGGEATNPTLREAGGPELKTDARNKLADRKLVTVDTSTTPYRFELTDAGWRWCQDELGANPPDRPGPLGKALYLLLPGFARHLDRTDTRLADVFGVVDDDGGSDGDLDERIRAAYRKLAPRPRGWVGLADLRPQLGSARRADVDAALKRLFRTPQVSLVPESNQKVLEADDRAAAIRIGGEDKHLISIDDA